MAKGRKSPSLVKRGAWRTITPHFTDEGNQYIDNIHKQPVQQPVTTHPKPQKHTPEDK